MATGAQDVTDREGEEEIFQVSEQQRQPGAMGGGGLVLGEGRVTVGLLGRKAEKSPSWPSSQGKSC